MATTPWTDVPTGSPCQLRFVQVPHRKDEAVDRLRATYVLVDDGQEGRVLQAFNLRDRTGPGSKTYGLEHMAFTSFSTQELDEHSLNAGFLLLERLTASGPATYSGFFNRVSPSHSGFHFQFVREELPIWKHLDEDQGIPVFQDPSGATVLRLKDWFFSVWCFQAKRPCDAARLAWASINDDQAVYDVLIATSRGAYRCIPVRRRRRKPVSMCVTMPEHYGDFGGMELSGTLILTHLEMFDRLKSEDPVALAARIRSGFQRDL